MDDVRVWEFRDRKSGEVRRYEQSELTIDGEMQLLRFASEAAARLRDARFPFEKLGGLFPEDPTQGGVNMAIAMEMVSILTAEGADLLTRGAATLLSLWEFDEDRKRNPTYADDVAFLRKCIKTADIAEMIETFVDQNDIDRLRRPFFRALSLYSQQATPETLTGPSTFSPAPDTAPPSPSDDETPGPRSEVT